MVDSIYEIERFVLHNVDRCPLTGRYGGQRLLTEEYGDLDIESYDVKTNVVHTQTLDRLTKRSFHLGNEGKTDQELYKNTLLAQWAVLRVHYLLDENRIDYLPAMYASLIAMDKEELQIFKDSRK